jgi:hypothetical protein
MGPHRLRLRVRVEVERRPEGEGESWHEALPRLRALLGRHPWLLARAPTRRRRQEP